MDSSRIIRSTLSHKELPFDSLADLIVDRLKTDPDKICFIDCILDRKWTKKQVLDSSLNFAYYLINDCQLRKGEIVCFVVHNSDIHAVSIIGVLAAGGVYMSLPENSAEREVKEVIEICKPAVLVCLGNNFSSMSKVVEDFVFIRKLLVIDEQSKSQIRGKSDLLTIEKILDQKRDECPRACRLPIACRLDDCATLVMSSGSTGRSKAILRTNRNLLVQIATFEHKELWLSSPDDILLSSGFFHTTGQVALFYAINGGAQLAIIRREKSYENVFRNINKYQITSGFVIPTQLRNWVQNDGKYDKNYLKSFQNMMVTGSPLPESTYRAMVDKFDMAKFRNSYGMSEVDTAIMVYLSDSKRLDNIETIGKVMPGLEVKVIDDEGNALAHNEPGELCFKGDAVTPGYLNNEAENEKLFTQDGFLRSGDLVYYDDKEFFYIISRIKEIIKVEELNRVLPNQLNAILLCQGYIVSPAELENIILQIPNVENAAVIGIKDEERDEIPMAFVTLVEGSTITAPDIQDYVDSRVNYFKKLRGGVRIIDKMPMTPSKKINKPELKKMIPELL